MASIVMRNNIYNTMNYCPCDKCVDRRILESGHDCITSFDLSDEVDAVLEAHLGWIFISLVSLVILRYGRILSQDTAVHIADHFVQWLDKHDFFQNEVPDKIRRIFSALVVCTALEELKYFNIPQLN
jgi:hypothetical protein